MKKIVGFHVSTPAMLLASLSIFCCVSSENNAPKPVITNFSPTSGLVGTGLTIYGNSFIPAVPPENGVGPHPNTSIIKINGIMAEAEYVYQDSISKQRINTTVPPGTTSGKISVTANGMTAFSQDIFTVTIPIYVPNVSVATEVNSLDCHDIDLDADGNFYISPNESKSVQKIASDGTATVVYDATALTLGIAVDKDGNVYTTSGNQIVKIKPDGTFLTLAGSTPGFSDGNGGNAKFNIPWGIDIDANGNLFVADFSNHKLRKITSDGIVTTTAGSNRGSTDGQGVKCSVRLSARTGAR